MLSNDSLHSKQFLLLAHLYARTDQSTLAFLRKALITPKYSKAETVRIGGLTLAGVTGEQVWTILSYDTSSCLSVD